MRRAPDMEADRTLVLLHGLGRTRWSLWPVARAGVRRGWSVVNVGYPSRRWEIEPLAELVAGRIDREVPDGPLDFVTHSLGGIILRFAVASGLIARERVKRVVMLAPPNQGSELTDRLRDLWLYQLITGPAGQQLGTDRDSVPTRLPAVPFELGVIAGSKPGNPIFAGLFGGPGDGKVSIERARVAGMRDFLIVARTHTFLMWAPEVLDQLFHFLDHGNFVRPLVGSRDTAIVRAGERLRVDAPDDHAKRSNDPGDPDVHDEPDDA